MDWTKASNKSVVLVGDFDLNLFDFCHSHSVEIYANELFKNNLLTLINKPKHVTCKYVSAIDHINFLFNSNFKPGIIKTNLSDHFPIFMTCRRSEKFFKNTEYTKNAQIVYGKIFSEKN